MDRRGPRRPGPLLSAGVLLVAGWTFLLAGCEKRPRAPALRDDPVYQSDSEGFRFLAPQGWTQSTRAEVPPGKVTTEFPLVQYRPLKGPAGASFRVSLIDMSRSADLAAHLAGPSYGVTTWRQTGPPEEIAVGSASAVRHSFTGRAGKQDVVKEVVCVRRGERVYLFTALYPAKDTEVRDQLRRVVESIIWKD
jgi:hypothetical protein